MKPALARNSLFLMAARGQAPGEQAMYLTGTMATLPEPIRLLMEVSASRIWGVGVGYRVVGWLSPKTCRSLTAFCQSRAALARPARLGAEMWVPRGCMQLALGQTWGNDTREGSCRLQ